VKEAVPQQRNLSALMRRLTDSQKEQVELKLMFGAVDRAAIISLFFAFAFPIYSVTNFQFTLKVDPTITMWSNFWPQCLFAGLPFLALFWTFRKFKTRTKLKMWLWSLSYPLILAASNMINVWPLMTSGHPEIYLNVHAACFIATIMAVSLVAPPAKFLYSMLGMTALTYILPVCWIFFSTGNDDLMKFVVNDASYSFFLAILCAKTTFRLRSALATDDVLNQQKIEKFVGNIVSQSIFEKNESLLDSRFGHGFLISLDVRGYTQLVKAMDPAVARRFKVSYHKMVATTVGKSGGFIHKTHGDGHLISLGLMNSQEDPSLNMEAAGVEGQLAENYGNQLRNAIAIFENVFEQFENLKKELGVDPKVCVCASIDWGEIGLTVLGDPDVRLEFDIEGMVVIRCARLEAFTKVLREVFSPYNSYLVVSSSASSYLFGDRNFQVFKTDQHSVKDFPDEAFVTYREYKSHRQIESKKAA
jgi:class 3 adenylate cyclase